MAGRILSLLLPVAGLCTAVFLSADLRLHIADLVRHLRSGDWEIVSDKPYLDQYVRSRYRAEPSSWQVSYVAGSGHAFSLLPEHRHASLLEIGQAALSDQPALSYLTTSLPSAYGALLEDALADVADGWGSDGGNELRRIVSSMRDGILNRSDAARGPSRRAVSLLAARPNTDLLRQALSAYQGFADSRGLDFPSFDVGTLPPYDVSGAWDGAAVILPQQGRCRAAVGALGANAETVEADVKINPRLLEVQIDRRWMSDALLDTLATRSGRAVRFFREGGTLRLVPARLWILMPETLTLSVIEPARADAVTRWAADGTCCRVSCVDFTVRLSPSTVRRNEQGQFFALRADVEPVLYAVVSRRRMAP